jgi:sigma-B regulation protein RsbU (phosphoserine phosphatase)
MGKNKNAVLLVIEDSVRAGVIEAQFLAIGRVIQTLRDKETLPASQGSDMQTIVLAAEQVKLGSKHQINQFKQLCATYLVLISLLPENQDQVAKFFRLGAVDVLLAGDTSDMLEQTMTRLAQVATIRQQQVIDRAKLESTNDELQESLRLLKQDQIAGLEVQKSLMPESPLSAGEYQISHSIVPSLYLSGDFVGYNVVLGRYLLFYFADVSGHGASSAFVTVLLRFMVGRVIRRHQLEEDYAALAMAPQGLVEHINSQMLATGLGKHMTLFAGSVDMDNNVMRYVVGAQLPPPILVVDGEAVFLPGKGKPVGIFKDVTWHVEELKMPERSSLVLLSDGVFDLFPEAQIADKEAAILKLLATRSGTLEDLKEALQIDYIEEPQDDISLLLLTRGM